MSDSNGEASQNPFTSASQAPIAPLPSQAYLKLRRWVIILTILLIATLLVTLLYINGKSLYDNGL
jgi:hypothetical protein